MPFANSPIPFIQIFFPPYYLIVSFVPVIFTGFSYWMGTKLSSKSLPVSSPLPPDPSWPTPSMPVTSTVTSVTSKTLRREPTSKVSSWPSSTCWKISHCPKKARWKSMPTVRLLQTPVRSGYFSTGTSAMATP